MTKRVISWTGTLVIFLGILTPSGLAAQERDRDRARVCFYQDIRFQGWEQCYFPGDEVIDLRDRRNAISSIRIFGRSRVILFDNTQFRGPSLEINSDVADLDLRSMSDSRSWNDRVDSIRVAEAFPTSVPARGRNNDNGFDGRDGICVFEHANFRGRSQCLDAGIDVRELGRSGDWNDRISSVQVVGNGSAMLYENIAFQGERLVIDRDVPDLAVIRLRDGASWNDRASSLEVREDRGRGRGRGLNRR